MQQAQNRPLFLLPWIGIVVATFAAAGEWVVEDASSKAHKEGLVETEAFSERNIHSNTSEALDFLRASPASLDSSATHGILDEPPLDTQENPIHLAPQTAPPLPLKNDSQAFQEAYLRTGQTGWFRPTFASAPILATSVNHRGAKQKLLRLPNGVFLQEWVLFYEEAIPSKTKIAHALQFVKHSLEEDGQANSDGSDSNSSAGDQGTQGSSDSNDSPYDWSSLSRLIECQPGSVKVITKAPAATLNRLKTKLSALR